MRSSPSSLEIAALNRELLAYDAPATTSGRTTPSAISLLPSSSLDGQFSERRPSVTNVPNEYSAFYHGAESATLEEHMYL